MNAKDGEQAGAKDDRAQRLGAALRANLQRRKARQRSQGEGVPACAEPRNVDKER